MLDFSTDQILVPSIVQCAIVCNVVLAMNLFKAVCRIVQCRLHYVVCSLQFAVCRGWLVGGGTWESSNCFLGAAETRELPLLVGAFPS